MNKKTLNHVPHEEATNVNTSELHNQEDNYDIQCNSAESIDGGKCDSVGENRCSKKSGIRKQEPDCNVEEIQSRNQKLTRPVACDPVDTDELLCSGSLNSDHARKYVREFTSDGASKKQLVINQTSTMSHG